MRAAPARRPPLSPCPPPGRAHRIRLRRAGLPQATPELERAAGARSGSRVRGARRQAGRALGAGPGQDPAERDRGSVEDPSLAAIGLETPDPGGLGQTRAVAALPTLPRRRAPHDAPLDSVAAPDGTALFFCRTAQPDHTSWTDDFTGTPVEPAARRDHPHRPRGAHAAVAPLRRGLALLPQRPRPATAGEPGAGRPLRPAPEQGGDQRRRHRAHGAQRGLRRRQRPSPTSPGSTSRWPAGTSSPRPADFALSAACCCRSPTTTTTTSRPATTWGPSDIGCSGSSDCSMTVIRTASSFTSTRSPSGGVLRDRPAPRRL